MRVFEGDGNCFFRAIAVSAYGTENEWQRIRQELADFMDENRPLLFPFCADGLDSMVSVPF